MYAMSTRLWYWAAHIYGTNFIDGGFMPMVGHLHEGCHCYVWILCGYNTGRDSGEMIVLEGRMLGLWDQNILGVFMGGNLTGVFSSHICGVHQCG